MTPFTRHSQKNKTTVMERYQWLPGVLSGRDMIIKMIIKGQHEEVCWTDGIVLNPECSGGYRDLIVC